MSNNNDNRKGENESENKVKGKEIIHLEDGGRVEFEGYYNQNKPYNGRIEKYDKDNNLIMKGGFLCLDGHPTYDKRNYHGKIIEYKYGKIQHTGTYEQFGVEEIIPTGEHMYYYYNGNVKRRETYNKYGNLDGEVEAYDDDGHLEFSGIFTNGACRGTYYYYNGKVKRKETCNKYGKLDGSVEKYDDAGHLEFSGTFNNGVGRGTYYHTDSQNVRRIVYEGDVEFSEGSETYLGPFITPMRDIYPHGNGKVYDDRGILRYEGRYRNGKRNGLVKEYHDNGTLRCATEHKDDAYNGLLREYNDNGKLIYEAKFIDGNRNGMVRKYNDNGNLTFEGEYSNNMPIGRAKKYDDNGHLIFEGEYKDGKGKGNGKEYDANGNLTFEGEYYDRCRNGHGKEYNNNGKLIFEGEFVYGSKSGPGKEYDGNDNLIFEGEYDDDMRNGPGKAYDGNGNLIFKGSYLDNRLYDGERYTYNSEGELIKKETIKNEEVVQQTNYISNENKFNLGSQNNGLGKK